MYSRYDLSFTFFPPLRDLGVDLVAQLGLDLARISGKEREETLCARVDDVDFVQRDSVDELASFLDFAFRALDESCLHRPISQSEQEECVGY